MIDNAIFILVIIKCAIKTILGMTAIVHALLKIALYLTMWIIWESPFWIMRKVFESACNELPAKGSKRQVEPKRNMKYKRRKNSGGEATALYFRRKRYFNRFQANHCNGRQRKKKFGRRNASKRSKKRRSKKKRGRPKFKERGVDNQSKTKKRKKYHHKLGSARTSKIKRNKVKPEVPVESKVPVKSKVTVPVMNFFKSIKTVTKFCFDYFLPKQIEQVVLAHIEDNSEEMDSTTTTKQGRSSKPRSETHKVKFQKPATQKRMNNGDTTKSGKK